MTSASGDFHLLAREADCCRWTRSVDRSIQGQSYHAYGTVLGGLTAQDLKEGGVRTGPTLESVSAPAGCEEACLSSRRCNFFSHSTALRTCVFCSTCALTGVGPGRSFTAWARNQVAPRRSPFTWAASLLARKSTATRDRYQEVAATYDDLLGPILQGNYSQTLYGAPGRVPLHDLRVVWLDLLPARSLRRLSQVGMCKWEAKPPFQPFYFLQDIRAGPVNAMWLSRFPPEVPFASHTWVEVVHCPNRRATSGRRRLERQPLMNWKFRPMWCYHAPGSGVSINLGRTVAVRSYDAAVWLLRRMFPRSVPPNTSCAQLSTLARRAAGTEASRQGTTTRGTTPTPTYGIQDVVHGDIDLRPVDSIQILSHREPHAPAQYGVQLRTCLTNCFCTREPPRHATTQPRHATTLFAHFFLAGEYFSRESKFEIVLLEWGAECMELSPSSPQVHCGRYPHFKCHSRATSISRLAKCASFNGKLMGKRVSGSMQTYSRFGNSPCSSSPCYSVQDRWFCPVMAAGS